MVLTSANEDIIPFDESPEGPPEQIMSPLRGNEREEQVIERPQNRILTNEQEEIKNIALLAKRLQQSQRQVQQQSQRPQQPRNCPRGPVPEELSRFSAINEQLANLGLTTWYIGNQPVDPMMSIVSIFILLSMGIPGLLWIGLIYLILNFSDP